MELSGRTENNRVVNFEGTPDMIGKFVDVEIVEVLTRTSLRGKVVRTEDEMGLRCTTPESVISHPQSQRFWRGYLPALILLACLSGRPCISSHRPPNIYRNACAFILWRE